MVQQAFVEWILALYVNIASALRFDFDSFYICIIMRIIFEPAAFAEPASWRRAECECPENAHCSGLLWAEKSGDGTFALAAN
jgi:hypothetical protein